jgi:hypothetical protein
MNDQPTTLTDQQLDEIDARAAHLYEYVTLTDGPFQAEADQLTGVDVPALLAAHADTDDLRTRAELCAEGDCPHAHQARKVEREASGYRHELETLADYLDDRDGIDPAVAVTLRGILARALDR